MFPADAAADFPCPFSFLTFALQLFFTELLQCLFVFWSFRLKRASLLFTRQTGAL
jgi:hypothetical protein